ncbi:MAG: hypothetical protein AAB612_03280 [Patescibacteria group bacterium]
MPALKTMTLTKADLQFKIDQLRQDKMIFPIESIQVSFIAVLTAVFLPEILFRTVYGNGTSGLNPEILSWIPTVSYAIAVLFFVFAAVGNIMRWKKIKRLNRQLDVAQK